MGRERWAPVVGWSAYVRHLRERRGWTRQELATHLGIGLRTIEYWEAGATRPSPVFARLVRELGEEPEGAG